jgi:flagellar biosynthesis chaperone FliJ
LLQALSDKDDLEFSLKHAVLERDHVKEDLNSVIKERDELEAQQLELKTRVRELSNVEAENQVLEGQVANLSTSLKDRVSFCPTHFTFQPTRLALFFSPFFF